MDHKEDAETERITNFLVSNLLGEAAAAQYEAGKLPKSTILPISQHVRTLSDRYTSHLVGKLLRQPVLTEREAIAYALYYVPINFAKVVWLLRRLTLPDHYHVLDYGCGPGTGALATLFSPHRPVSVTCVDHSPAMRTVASRLLLSLSKEHPKTEFQVVSDSDPVVDQGRFHLIIVANVLAEMNHPDSLEVVARLSRLLHPNGYLMLIEPGQPDHTRRLMTLRDTICKEHPRLVPFFPCCTTRPCPMLMTSTDNWCHGTLAWQRPRLTRQFDESLEFNKHRLKFSAFVFQHDGVLKSGYRVIEPGQRSKRGIEASLCGADFYGTVRIRPVARSNQNRDLERSEVFDLLSLSYPAETELPSDTQVTLLE